jgi:hypothetical protein
MKTKVWFLLGLLLLGVAMIFVLLVRRAPQTQSGTCGENPTWSPDDNSGTPTISDTEAPTDYPYDSIPSQSGTCGENLTWSLDDNGTLTIRGTGAMTGDSIPWCGLPIEKVIIEDGVTSIKDVSFSNCAVGGLTTVTFGNSVTDIGDWAFSYCYDLTDIIVENGNVSYSAENGILFNKDKTILICYPEGKEELSYIIPNSVTNIGEGAFYRCGSLTAVTIPSGVSNIEYGAFSDCYRLPAVAIPNSVKSIGGRAFAKCFGLIATVIPNGVTSIGSETFAECASLNTVTIPNSVKSIGGYAFRDCYSLITVINLNPTPQDIDTLDVFSDVDLSNVTLYVPAESVEAYKAADVWKDFGTITHYSVESGVLFNKDKTTLICYPSGKAGSSYIIPNGVKSIGNWAFFGCDSLVAVTIGNSVTSIEDIAFFDCRSLTAVTIGDSVQSIGNWPFSDCFGLTDILVENGNVSYSAESGVLFNKDKTTLVCYPIGKAGSSYMIPNSVTNIEMGAFYRCGNLIAVTIPNSVKSIGHGAFFGCYSLTAVTIPNSVKSIERGTFSNCTSLTTVTIGNSVKSIGYYAFRGCYSLTTVTNWNPKPQDLEDDVFNGIDLSEATLYVPFKSVEAYKAADVWKDFGKITHIQP